MSVNWSEVPLKALFRRRDATGYPDMELLSVYRDFGVIPRAGREDNNNRPGEDLSAYRVVRRGDLVLNKMKTWQGSLGISEYDGIVSPAYFVCEQVGNAHPKYLHHLLRSQPLIAEYAKRSKGIRPAQWDLPWDEFRDIRVLLPPIKVQQAIADYLDTETASINALINKKQHMISLILERLRTLITVWTKNGPGVQVRHLISLRTSGPRGWANLVTETGTPFIRSANLQRESIEIKTDNLVYVTPPMTEEAKRSTVRDGDVLIGITGANTGWVGCVPNNLVGSFVSQHVAILRPTSVEPQWLAYSLFSRRAQDQLLGSQYGGTKQQLSLDDLAELRIACPDREEQLWRTKAMASAHLATKKIVTLLEGQIELLKERRQALITAAVTGELKIPTQEAVVWK